MNSVKYYCNLKYAFNRNSIVLNVIYSCDDKSAFSGAMTCQGYLMYRKNNNNTHIL